MAKSEKPANPKRKGTPHNDFFIQQWSDLKVAQAFFKALFAINIDKFSASVILSPELLNFL